MLGPCLTHRSSAKHQGTWSLGARNLETGRVDHSLGGSTQRSGLSRFTQRCRDRRWHQFPNLVAENSGIKPVEGELGIRSITAQQSQQIGPPRRIENKDVLLFASHQRENVDFAAHVIHSVPRFRSPSQCAPPRLAFVSTDRPSKDQTTFKLPAARRERFHHMPMAAKTYKVFAALEIRLPAPKPHVVTKVKVLLK